MLRLLVIAGFICLSTASFNFDSIPSEYRELIPPEVKEYLDSLTEADKAVLKDVAEHYSKYKNEEEAIEAIKEKSPELGAKTQELYNSIKKKVDGLSPHLKEFVFEMLAGVRHFHTEAVAGRKVNLAEMKQKAQASIDKYNALSDSEKAEFEREFPSHSAVFKSDKFHKMVAGLQTQ